MSKYYSQYRQDSFIDWVVFFKKKCGFFIDIGAHDGISFSNTIFLEKVRGWGGMCFEPNPDVFQNLSINRNSINYNCCIGNQDTFVDFWKIEGDSEMLSGIKNYYDENHIQRIFKENRISGGTVNEIKVSMKPLMFFKEIHNMIIDYVSLDTEGNELSVLQSIDFNVLNIYSLSVENNYKDKRIDNLLLNNGFVKLIELRCDSIFIKKELDTRFLRIRLVVWRVWFDVLDFISKKSSNVKARLRRLSIH